MISTQVTVSGKTVLESGNFTLFNDEIAEIKLAPDENHMKFDDENKERELKFKFEFDERDEIDDSKIQIDNVDDSTLKLTIINHFHDPTFGSVTPRRGGQLNHSSLEKCLEARYYSIIMCHKESLMGNARLISFIRFIWGMILMTDQDTDSDQEDDQASSLLDNIDNDIKIHDTKDPDEIYIYNKAIETKTRT